MLVFFYLLLFLHVSTIFALKKKHKNIRVEDWVSQYMKFINFYNNHINPQNILCLFKTSRAFLPKQIEREEKNYGAENCKKNLNKKNPNTSGSWQGVLRKWLVGDEKDSGCNGFLEVTHLFGEVLPFWGGLEKVNPVRTWIIMSCHVSGAVCFGSTRRLKESLLLVDNTKNILFPYLECRRRGRYMIYVHACCNIYSLVLLDIR